MFTLNQAVICTDATGQPTLQEGRTYIVREVGARGIRVSSLTGDIRYEFSNARFVAPVVVAPVAIAPVTDSHPHPIARRGGILIVDGLAYEVFITSSEIPDVWEIANVVELTY